MATISYDSDGLSSLQSTILPELLLGSASQEDFRVWVPGCGSGEEVYALAIVFSDFLREHDFSRAIKIFGTDQNESLLIRARNGVYPHAIAASFPGVSLAHFTRVEGGYQVSQEIRAICHFTRHDALRDAPMERMDLISARSLPLEPGTALQHFLSTCLHSLRPTGRLMLKPTDRRVDLDRHFVMLEPGVYMPVRRPADMELRTKHDRLQVENEELSAANDELLGQNAELHKTNLDLAFLLSSLQAPVVILNSDLKVRRFSPVPDEFPNGTTPGGSDPLTYLFPHVDLPDVKDLIHQVLRDARPKERCVQDSDGRWFSLSIQPYRTSEGTADGVVLQLVNTDLLKRPFKAIEAARDYAEAIIATVREPLLVLDQYLTVLSANQSFYNSFEIAPEETLQRSIFELGGRQWDIPHVRQMLERIVAGAGPVQDIEIEHDFPRVGWRVFQMNARRIQNDTGQHLILVAVEDITDRKRAAEDKYRRLFESAKDGILIMDAPTGVITDANPYVAELFGYTRAELLGRLFWEVEPLAELPGGSCALRRIHEEETVRFADIPIHVKNGTKLDAEIVANVYSEGDKKVIQFNLRDITARKHLEHQLRESAKLESLGLLAGGVAHDFNNILTGIMGNASLALTDTELGAEDQKSLLREVINSSQRAAELTRQMLAYAGRGRYVIRQVNLSDVVREISALVRTSVPRRVGLDLRLAADLPLIEADVVQIQQLVMNLVINAAEAIVDGREGVVRVTTNVEHLTPESITQNLAGSNLSPGTYINLQVSDNGSGMDEETRAKIFDPFFTTKFTGRGLGLAAAQGIVRGHKGAIRVFSKLGSGSTFKVLFPSAEAAAQEQIERATSPSEIVRGSETVLVVDDEGIVLRLARAALIAHGYRVLTAENGQIALSLMETEGDQIDAVVLDLTMPVMGGAEALDSIKALRPELPVILSSGYDEAEAINRFAGRPLAGFVQKPYTVEEILAVVRRAISSKSPRHLQAEI